MNKGRVGKAQLLGILLTMVDHRTKLTEEVVADLRKRYNIKDGVDGVVVVRVDQGSKAAERFIQAGDTIIEVQRTPVKSVEDLTKRLGELKKDGRSNALFYVANAQGDLRYVTLPVE